MKRPLAIKMHDTASAHLSYLAAETTIRITEGIEEAVEYKYGFDESSGIAITDQDGIIKHVNANFCKLSKYDRQELIWQDHRIVNSGYHTKDFIRRLWETISEGHIWKGDIKNKAKDGGFYWVSTTIVPLLTVEGQPRQYIAITLDITEHKIAEERQVLLASIVNSTDDAIVSTNIETFITSWNEGAEAMFGYKAEEVLGKSVVMLIDPRRLGEESAIMERLAQGEYVKHHETEWVSKDGKIVPVSLNASPIKNTNGIVIGNAKIVRNISERKEAQKIKMALEEIVRASENIYRTIASNIPGSVVCILDAEYRFQLIAGDMVEKFGYQKKRLLAKKASDVLTAGCYSQLEADFDRVLRGESFTTENHQMDYDLVVRYVPLTDDHNIVYAAMIVAIDVTELKIALRHIEQLNIDLEHKVNERTEQLAIVNKEMEAFTYSVSHDLRAPLRGIIGFATILEEDYASKLDSEAKRITAIIKANTLKMGRLIDDLLSFSQMARQDISKVLIDMQEMVNEVIMELTPAKPPVVHWQVNPLPAAKGDSNIIRQVWVNLISNAIKYSRSATAPRIEIGAFMNEGQQCFFIKDNGVGFDNKYRSKLFKVFQRLHSASQFEGTGIGLALVMKIISKHGGRVWAEGETGEGACFFFTLPVD